MTGRPVYAESPSGYGEPVAAIATALESLAHRIGLLEDADQLERLNAIYGYYLARNQWDDLAGIFARDGDRNAWRLRWAGERAPQPRSLW